MLTLIFFSVIMIFPSLEGKLFQLCLKSDIFPTLTPNTNKISTQTKKCKISQLWPKNANFFNSDQNMHAMYALMTSLVLSFLHLMGVRPVQTYCWKKVWTSHLPSPTYNVIICQLFFALKRFIFQLQLQLCKGLF